MQGRREHKSSNLQPCEDFLRDLYLENNSRAVCYTTACLSTHSSKQGLFCMKTGKGEQYTILVSAVDELLYHGECEYELALARGNCKPAGRGLGLIRELSMHPWPTVWYSIGALTLKKEVQLAADQPELLIRYTLEEGFPNSELVFKPFLAFRNALSVQRNEGTPQFVSQSFGKSQVQVKIKDPGFPRLWISATGNSGYIESPEWRHEVAYQKTHAAKTSEYEDLFSPGYYKSSISPGESILLSISGLQQSHTSASEFEEVLQTKR